MEILSCFFVMPFRPELNFFWLYLSKHIEEKHQIKCHRGDSIYKALPLNIKVLRYIEDANFIIVDITGRNPNVMYELGIADNMGKKVIALYQKTADINEIPTDIKYKEVILYSLDDHINLITQLDLAIDNLLDKGYNKLYNKGIELLKKFNTKYNLSCIETDEQTFIQLVRNSEKLTGLPDNDDEIELKSFLLPKIIQDSTRPELMQRILIYLDESE